MDLHSNYSQLECQFDCMLAKKFYAFPQPLQANFGIVLYLQISHNHFLLNSYLTTNHDNLPMSLNALQPLQMKRCCLMTHKPVKLPTIFQFLPTIPDSYRDN